jgi:hypothetical protein
MGKSGSDVEKNLLPPLIQQPSYTSPWCIQAELFGMGTFSMMSMSFLWFL